MALPSPGDLKAMATSQRSMLADLSGTKSRRGLLSKGDQLAGYRSLTGNSNWLDSALQGA